MPIDPQNWPSEVLPTNIPNFPCPSCANGTLEYVPDSLRCYEPQHSIEAHGHEAWDPDWIVERFALLLKCTNKKCMEFVFVIGDASHTEAYDEDGPNWEQVLRPKYFNPAPPIFRIPADTPANVAENIEAAFGLFWSDVSSAMNKIRISLEALLDDLHIPAKMKVTKNGKDKFVELKLHARIENYKKKNPQIGDLLLAIKAVGNLGSHQDAPVSRDAVFDVFEIYETALGEIYDHKTETISKKAKALIKSKGKRTAKKKAGKKK